MIKSGDYVLVRSIPDTDPGDYTYVLPAWARTIYFSYFGGYDITIDFGDDKYWGVGNKDLVPEAEITDEQWAELAKWRLSQ